MGWIITYPEKEEPKTGGFLENASYVGGSAYEKRRQGS